MEKVQDNYAVARITTGGGMHRGDVVRIRVQSIEVCMTTTSLAGRFLLSGRIVSKLVHQLTNRYIKLRVGVAVTLTDCT